MRHSVSPSVRLLCRSLKANKIEVLDFQKPENPAVDPCEIREFTVSCLSGRVLEVNHQDPETGVRGTPSQLQLDDRLTLASGRADDREDTPENTTVPVPRRQASWYTRMDSLPPRLSRVLILDFSQ